MQSSIDWNFINEIKTSYRIAFINHFTHIKNLPNIIQAGGLLAKSKMNPESYLDISNQGIQGARSNISVGGSGKGLHEFVPHYFCVKSPMISQLRAYNDQLIYLQFRLDLLKRGGVFLSDGNARDNNTRFYEFTGIDTLKNLDVGSINTNKFAHSAEIKRKKQAEALVPDRVPLSYLYNIACNSEKSCTRVMENLSRSGLENAISTTMSSHFYYS